MVKFIFLQEKNIYKPTVKGHRPMCGAIYLIRFYLNINDYVYFMFRLYKCNNECIWL